jgi:hypothetical protein
MMEERERMEHNLPQLSRLWDSFFRESASTTAKTL